MLIGRAEVRVVRIGQELGGKKTLQPRGKNWGRGSELGRYDRPPLEGVNWYLVSPPLAYPPHSTHRHNTTCCREMIAAGGADSQASAAGAAQAERVHARLGKKTMDPKYALNAAIVDNSAVHVALLLTHGEDAKAQDWAEDDEKPLEEFVLRAFAFADTNWDIAKLLIAGGARLSTSFATSFVTCSHEDDVCRARQTLEKVEELERAVLRAPAVQSFDKQKLEHIRRGVTAAADAGYLSRYRFE